MTDEITLESDEEEKDLEMLLAGLSFVQMEAAKARDDKKVVRSSELIKRLLEENPDVGRKTVKHIVKQGHAAMSLPREMADTLDMDADEWGIFHEEEQSMDDATEIDIE